MCLISYHLLLSMHLIPLLSSNANKTKIIRIKGQVGVINTKFVKCYGNNLLFFSFDWKDWVIPSITSHKTLQSMHRNILRKSIIFFWKRKKIKATIIKNLHFIKSKTMIMNSDNSLRQHSWAQVESNESNTNKMKW